MSNLINLTFGAVSPIRIINQNGDFWFVANDVCHVLKIQNTTQALQSLDDDEKAKIDTTSSPMFNIALDNRIKQINIINESGLYALILRSRKAMQKGTVQHKFRKWVTADVLPTLRKTGTYTRTTCAQSPKLSAADYATIQIAIEHISIGMHFVNASKHAIYKRLRTLCNINSMNDLRYEHLPLVQNELYRIERTLSPYIKMRMQTEKQLLRRICASDDIAAVSAILDIEKTAHDYSTACEKRLSNAAIISRIGKLGGAK